MEQDERQRPAAAGPPGVPGWVKAFLIAVLVVGLLLAVLLLSGHGPRLHAPAPAGVPAGALALRLRLD